MTDGVEQSVLDRLKCRLTGHDWTYHRTRGERTCYRCYTTEEYSVEETHTDEGAEKGARRYRIDEESGSLFIEEYQTTAWGTNTEYWQWFPTGRGPATEEHLLQLREEINRVLGAEEPTDTQDTGVDRNE